MNRIITCTSLAICLAALTACGSSSDHRDLQQYIQQTKARPAGQIEPLPAFQPYRPFSYSAMTLRSPFDPPAREEERRTQLSGEQVQPDLNREKEYLESFNVANLTMVGTLTKGGQLWALINDGLGGIHAVTEGNYLGKNHGRIVSASRSQLELLEIVADGANGWVERPRIIELQEKE